MVKYVVVAIILRIFSVLPLSKRLYRHIGNFIGSRIRLRIGLTTNYKNRAKIIIKQFLQLNILPEGNRYLELGTGWVHWESTILSLFYNGEYFLYDIWDNRQFQSFKAYVLDFYQVFDEELSGLPIKYQEARTLLERIASASSFDQLYDLLNFHYVVDPTGTLSKLESNSFDVCFSHNVFEHVDKENIHNYVNKLYELLKPGGYSVQVIDLSDHLANYTQGVCKKNYLRYSNAVWKIFFENQVQYINRIQRREWLELFKRAGFTLIEEESFYQPINIKVNSDFKNMDKKDSECITLRMVHQKPFR